VRSPYSDAAAVSKDGTISYASVTLDGKTEDVPKEDVAKIIDTAKSIAADGLQVEVGGEAARNAEDKAGPTAELAGIVAALVILVLLLGSVLAASLPLITALFAVGGAIGLIALASHLFTVADFTPPILMLVGLGVGVDYALLIFYRHRHELTNGAQPAEAARRALDSAGRTVFFAGCTVITALLGLVALGLGSLQGVALAVAVTVLVTMAASLVLLPALLALCGGRIQRHVLKQAARTTARGKTEGSRWRAMAQAVQRRPIPTLLVGVIALLALSAPALGMRLGFADSGNDPEATTSRQAYDLLAEGFGPGINGPLSVVVVVPDGTSPDDTTTLLTNTATTLGQTPGVASVGAPNVDQAGDTAVLTVVPTTSPQDQATTELVDRLRSDVLPGVPADTYVVGTTAGYVDFTDKIAARMPWLILTVVALSFVLLTVAFRSVVIATKAAVLNLLSVGAAYGVVVAVFQWGWGSSWIGIEEDLPIPAFVPMLLFAIVFGLSMDYEVFLLSRVHEAWSATRDAHRSVAIGIGGTARVITTAAAVMVVVFSSFVLDPDPTVKMLAVGMAAAVLIDASVIRMVLVPAVMSLLGARAWWMPRWLDRVVPDVDIEGSAHLARVADLVPAPRSGEDARDDEVARTRPGS
jgi:putative drug exporter of the RND superfamily